MDEQIIWLSEAERAFRDAEQEMIAANVRNVSVYVRAERYAKESSHPEYVTAMDVKRAVSDCIRQRRRMSCPVE